MTEGHTIGTSSQLILHAQELEGLPENGQTWYKARLLSRTRNCKQTHQTIGHEKCGKTTQKEKRL